MFILIYVIYILWKFIVVNSVRILEENEQRNPLFSTEKENIDIEDTCESCVKNSRGRRNATENKNLNVGNKNTNVKTTEKKKGTWLWHRKPKV